MHKFKHVKMSVTWVVFIRFFFYKENKLIRFLCENNQMSLWFLTTSGAKFIVCNLIGRVLKVWGWKFKIVKVKMGV